MCVSPRSVAVGWGHMRVTAPRGHVEQEVPRVGRVVGGAGEAWMGQNCAPYGAAACDIAEWPYIRHFEGLKPLLLRTGLRRSTP